MRHDDIPDDLRPLVYDFFFWFSRFEYALKESRFLKYPNVGDRSEPGWDRFISDCKDGYRLSPAGKALIAAVASRPIDNVVVTDTAKRIAGVRASVEGKDGVAAFLEKRKARWIVET